MMTSVLTNKPVAACGSFDGRDGDELRRRLGGGRKIFGPVHTRRGHTSLQRIALTQYEYVYVYRC